MEAAILADVVSARNGDEAAFVRIVKGCSNMVCSIALSVVRNVDASEDVAQEVFVAAWTDLRKLRNPDSFLPWLRQITRNQARLWLRRQLREHTGQDERLEAHVDRRPDPASVLLEEEEQQIIAEVIEHLPDETREIVTLYYREGNSTIQVADLLGMTDAAVRQRLSRARVTIREDVLQRFGTIAARTAPATAFVASTAALIVAPAAQASVTSTVASGAIGLASTAVKGAAAGAIGGVLGVVMGMRHLGEPYDEKEAAELRAFSWQAVAVVVAGCVGMALTASPEPPRLLSLVPMTAMLAALAYLYWIRLPRILERRIRWEEELDPEMAKLNRGERLWGLLAHTIGAVLGGLAISFILLRWLD